MREERPARQPSQPSSDDELLRALRELGASYEPDLTTISHRTQQPAAVNWARAAPHSSRWPAAMAHTRPVVLPAAAVLLVMGGMVFVTSTHPNATAGATPAVPAEATTTETGSFRVPATPSPSLSPTALPKQPATAASTSHPATPNRKQNPTPTAARTSAKASATVQAQAAGTGTAVRLGGSGQLDWIAVGSRSDLKQVRSKPAAADPLITVAQPAGASSTAGRFFTSWVRGIPEEDHEAATDWLGSDGTAGLTVTVSASRQARTLVLYAGAQDLKAHVTVSGAGLSTRKTSLGTANAARAQIVTVSLPATTGPTRITLGGSAAGSDPQVYLAAVTLTND